MDLDIDHVEKYATTRLLVSNVTIMNMFVHLVIDHVEKFVINHQLVNNATIMG